MTYNKEYMAGYRERNRTKLAEYQKDWRRSNPASGTLSARRYRAKLKLEVLIHYSGTIPPQCANPFGQHKEPYTDIRALTIDHIKGGGNRHRHTQHYTDSYKWLKSRGFPDGYQVLCFNCQWVKVIVNRENYKGGETTIA